MSEKRKKKIPPLDPSLTEFEPYYKGSDGKWYRAGHVDFGDGDTGEVPESVVADAVYNDQQSAKRNPQGKLRKRCRVEAEQYASELVRAGQAQCPLAFDIKTVVLHPTLGTIQSVGKYLLTGYGFSSLEPETDPYAVVYPKIKCRGTSKVFT